jgi:hypothetical protein
MAEWWRPAMVHADLDLAVAEAYGWPADISEDEALARLFALNQKRAGTSGAIDLLDETVADAAIAAS